MPAVVPRVMYSDAPEVDEQPRNSGGCKCVFCEYGEIKETLDSNC
jgi:hypothetical protein